MERVRIILSVLVPNHMDLLLASERGFYARHGLEVELVPMSGDRGAAALVSGEVDFALQIGPALRRTVSGAGNFKTILVIHKNPPHWIMAPPGIRTAQDLRGKRVGAGGKGSDFSAMVENWLREEGLEPGRDVTVTHHMFAPPWARGWISMTDDAPMAIPLEMELLEARGYKPLVELTSRFPDVLIHGLVASARLLEERPGVARSMVRAHRDVARYIHDAPQAVTAFIQQRWGTDEATARRCYEYLAPVFVAQLAPSDLATVLAFNTKYLGVTPVAPEAFMDARFYREVLAAE